MDTGRGWAFGRLFGFGFARVWCRGRWREEGTRTDLLGRRRRAVGHIVAASLLALFLAVMPGPSAGAEDFAFLHFSDVHAPVAGSREVIALARDSGPTRLAPYGVTAPAPSFAVVTGDLTEFGGGEGAWDTYLSYWDGFRIPVYHVPGNHDDTWWLLRPAIRALHGGFPYAFDYGGCHFIALDSSGRQDPRPGFGREELEWLREHLRQVPRETPLFLFFHHPPQGSEWSSPYDYERLLAMLRSHHVALLLVGHGHAAVAMRLGGYDVVEGGSTFDLKAKPPSAGNAGYSIVSVQGGVLRVAYRRAAEAEATVGLLEKPFVPPAALPAPRFRAPGEGVRLGPGEVAVRLVFAGAAEATGEVALDAARPVPLTRSGRRWEARLDLREAQPGVHVLRALFREGDRMAIAHREFVVEAPGGPRLRWRVFPGGSIRAALAVSGDRVYAGSQDGALYCLDARSGRTRWRFRTGGEVLGRPAVAEDLVCVASTDGFLYGVRSDGRERWRYAAGAPLSAPPVLHADSVLIGAVDGVFHCVDRRTGGLRWRSSAATYTIESAACAFGDSVFFGAWDTFVYALQSTTGDLRWRSVGEGSRVERAARYFSPADCAPVYAGGRLFVADRDYRLIILDAATGERLGALDQCAAVAASAEGRSVYLHRFGGGTLTKVDLEGRELWSCKAGLGSLASAPVEQGDVVAVASDTGLVSAVSATDGRLLWQYRAAPGFYMPGGAVPADGNLYAAALDGGVAAIDGPRSR